MTLKDLQIGQSGRVTQIGGNGIHRQHFLDMGIIPNAVVTMVKHAPLGDPVEILIHGYSLILRLADAEQIEIELCQVKEDSSSEKSEESTFQQPEARVAETLHEHNSHPGFGEAGKYHDKENEHALPKDTLLTFALIGQQNCGKTTLFNQLTGSKQHVGNFPGVTVDRRTALFGDIQIRKSPICLDYILFLPTQRRKKCPSSS